MVSREMLPMAVLLAMLSPQPHAAEQQTLYPLLRYSCDQQADIAQVTNSLLKGEEGMNFEFSEEDGSYNPWDLVEIDNSDGRARIVSTKNIVKQCELSSGVYTITLEPRTFGKHLDGRCGAAISSSITITFDGIDILETTAFEDYCHGNSPIIVRVTTFGKTSEVKIKRIPKYKFY